MTTIGRVDEPVELQLLEDESGWEEDKSQGFEEVCLWVLKPYQIRYGSVYLSNLDHTKVISLMGLNRRSLENVRTQLFLPIPDVLILAHHTFPNLVSNLGEHEGVRHKAKCIMTTQLTMQLTMMADDATN